MVEQSFWETLARDAPLEPEKVQLVALFLKECSGAAVIIGSATGEAKVEAAKAARRVRVTGNMTKRILKERETIASVR